VDNALSEQIASAGKGRLVPFLQAPGAYVKNGRIVMENQEIIPVSELKLLGEHNWQNVCAAVTAVWEAGVHNTEAMRSVLREFKGLEHRLEFVREVSGVQYYNDSFGTTPETAIVAIQAFKEPKIVVLGGSDKGADYAELAKVVANSNVRTALLIGETAPKLQAVLEAAGYTNAQEGGKDMHEIMNKVVAVAQPGDVVLLSTASASFDMFKDYKDRGLQFKTAVQALS
jgi:UDP-N-acetylmuramoylalanine--D-glutamate ligase